MPSIEINDNKCVTINESCTIILKNKNIDIEYELIDGNYSILVFNDFNDDVVLNEHGTVRNSSVKINYLQLDKFDLNQYTKINVNRNSSLTVNTTYLATKNKTVTYDLFNCEEDSNVDIFNNIVCLKEANFSLECIGTIKKGAKRSKCHQKTNCLTFDSPNKAKVLPVLNIDENDVEASHSLSSGTLDEDILFYMNSRGLNKKEALNLILKSYLMPNDNYYDEFEQGKIIQEEAIKKVDEICSM